MTDPTYIAAQRKYDGQEAPQADALDEWIAAAPMPLYASDIKKLELMYAENTAQDGDE
jgi:hypothetical protein